MLQATCFIVGLVEMYAFIWAAYESDVTGAVTCACALTLTVMLSAAADKPSDGGPRYGV